MDMENTVICDLGGLIGLVTFSDGITLIDTTYKTEIKNNDNGG